jgi:hypothetical protein
MQRHRRGDEWYVLVREESGEVGMRAAVIIAGDTFLRHRMILGLRVIAILILEYVTTSSHSRI